MNNIEKRRLIIDERIQKNSLASEEDRVRKMQMVIEKLRAIGKEYAPYAYEKVEDEHLGGDRV